MKENRTESMRTIFIAFTLKNSSVAEFFVALSNFLSKEYKVIIFTHANEPHRFVLSHSITILRWPSKRPTRLKDLFFLIRQIGKYKPQTMIANFAAVNIFLVGGSLMGVKHRVAWYHTLTTQLKSKNFLKLRKGILYRLATSIFTNSQAAKLDLTHSFHIPFKKIEVVNNAVRDPAIKRAVKEKKLVFAGRLHRVKGVEILIRALAIVKKKFPDVELTVIGEDEGTGELAKLRSLQYELELENNIRFAGNRSREYVLEQFSTSYCTVVPSFFEAFGYVAIESFSVHTPVIGSDSTGIAEIVRNNIDGMLFTPGDHIELAQKIVELMNNKGLRNVMAENCYERFLLNYELNLVVKQFVKNSPIFR